MTCPTTEPDRLAALRRYAILDTAPEGPFDDLTRLASLICRTPIALISLVDEDRQWFKSCIGLDVRETPRRVAFCDHTIRRPDLLVVPEATADPRFADNPLVTGPPGIRFYAGAPLVTADGFALGTICAIDVVPREIDASQCEALEALARLVVGQLELRRKADELERADLASRRLAAIVESSDDAIIAKDLDGVITSWNASAERIFGYAAGEIIGRSITVLIPEASADEEAMIIGKIRRGERVDHFETRRRSKDGRLIDLSITVSPIRDASGTIVGASKIARDITERRRIEQDLRLLQAAVENANDAILITEAEPIDLPGPRVVYVNPAFTRTTGFAAAEIIGQTPRILQGPGTDRASLDALRSRLKSWRPVRAELLNYHKDGTEFWVELDIRPVADATGWFTHWVSIQRDITTRKRAERQRKELSEIQVRDLNARLEQRVRRLDSLRQVDLAIVSGHEMGRALEVIVAQAREQLQVDAASILIAEPGGRSLRFAAGVGFPTGEVVSARVRVGEGHAGIAMMDRKTVAVPDLADAASAALRAGLSEEGFISCYATPLLAKGQALGILEVFHRAPIRADGDWTAFLEALAGQAAIAIDNATLFHDLQRSNSELVSAYDATIEGWARALDLRDKETEGHTRRVTEMAVRLARAMGLRGDELLAVRRGAMLHDIGKMGIPDAILLKPGPLTEGERSIMMRHPAYAHEWLSPIPFLREALEIPYSHHEKLDGTGYPRGLKGEEIPLAARIFAAVDIWDALSSDRPYRRGWPEDRVRDHLRSLAGSHLDPGVVDALLCVLDSAGPPRPPIEPADQAGIDRPEGLPTWTPRRPNRARRLLLRCRDMRAENRTLAELATTDELTGLGNRRRLHNSLEEARSSAARRGWPISVILMDVDHFKSFNDAHGHSAGDGALRGLARLLRTNTRPHDVIARYGGEEFAIVAEDVDVEASRAYAERLRGLIEGHPWGVRAMTASFGIATGSAAEGLKLIEVADRALYRSKRKGRNCVTHHAEFTPISAEVMIGEAEKQR